MKSLLTRVSLTVFLLLGVTSLQISCSSSSTGTEEAVTTEGGESENAAEPNENSNQAAENDAAGNQGDEGSNNAVADSTQGAENNGGENAANNNVGLNQEAEGGNALANNPSGGGDEDLNQIIDEMNNSAGSQLPAQGENQGFGNIAGAEGGNAANPLAGAEGGNAANPLAGAEGVGAEGMATDGMATDGMATNGMAATEGGNAAPVDPAAAAPAAPMEPVASAPAAMGSPAAPGLPEIGSKMVYIVQKGDTLAKIAQKIFGESNKWTEIANFTGIANPRLIYPGDVVYYQLTEKSMAFASAYEGMKRSEVQVSQGDTLASIAGRVLGNSSLWRMIWRQNDNISNPDRLTAGTTLFYIAPAGMASLERNSSEDKVVVTQTKAQATKKMSAEKAPKVLEVASDFVGSGFLADSGHGQAPMQRSLI